MPVNKYKLEDFQSWIKKQSKEIRDTTAQKIYLNDDVEKSGGFTSLDDAFTTPCDWCRKKHRASHLGCSCIGSVAPDASCLSADCLRIKNIWEECCRKRDFRTLNGVQGWSLYNALGETAHDVILKWMNEVDNKEKIQSLEQKEEFTQNQLVLAPKK